jgi:hypothetical protein
MTQTVELSDLDQRVLRAVLAVERDDAAPTQQAVATRAHLLLGPVVGSLNRLFSAGLITASLTPTDAGRAAAGDG